MAHAEFDFVLRHYGTPFVMTVVRKEPVSAFRARLAKKFEVSTEEVARWKIMLCERGFGMTPRTLMDDDKLRPDKWTDSYLTVVHPNVHRAGYFREAGLVIRGVEEDKKKE